MFHPYATLAHIFIKEMKWKVCQLADMKDAE